MAERTVQEGLPGRMEDGGCSANYAVKRSHVLLGPWTIRGSAIRRARQAGVSKR
jgi:hypothetical protein